MPVQAISVTGTVVGTWDMVRDLLWLIGVVGLVVAGFWCMKLWHRRWWGWLLGIGCLAASGEMVRRGWEQGRREADARCEVNTDYRLMSLRSRLLSMRVSTKELRTADGETLVKALLAIPDGEYGRWTNDAGMLVDCWGNPLRIEVGMSVTEIKVSSAGRDGIVGTEDDLPGGE